MFSWITTRVRNDPPAQDNSFDNEMGIPRNSDICLGNQIVPLIEISSPEVIFIPITSYLLNETVVGDRGGVCISDYRHASVLMLSFFRGCQNLLKEFRTTDLDTTIQQLPAYALLNKELVQLGRRVFVYVAVIVTVNRDALKMNPSSSLTT